MTSPNTTELRIACVMNGGVSLAVWMAGVTHEIDLLRRASLGRSAADADVPTYDRGLWDRWRDAAGERRVVVDIVAGTSAGGINGTLLAAAAAGGGRLDWPEEGRGPLLRQLWEEQAGLNKLLPAPKDTTPRSLLDGGHLDTIIGSTLEAVARENDRHRARNEPTLHPVTLFVTATALGESDDVYRDGFDQEFRAQDHRRRYRFRYDSEHVEFDPDRRTFEKQPLEEFDGYPESLARATRASSSYPVAFEPVSELDDMLGPPVRVQPEAPAAAPAWLADGGILDNSPFEPVLQEIAHRAPDADVERLLVYVVPSRGTSAEDVEPGATPTPKWTAVVGSALRFPSESDFRDDIAEIRDLLFTANAQQQSVRLFCANAHGPGTPEAGRDLVDSAAVLLPTYWRGRVAGRIREARTLVEESGTRRAPRALQAPDDVLRIDEQLQALPPDERGEPQPPFRRSAAVLDRPWAWGVGAGERCARLFARDVMDHLAENKGAQIGEHATGLADVLRCISALSDVFDERLKALSPDQLASTRDARREVDQAAASLGVPVVMQDLMQQAAGHYAAAVRELGGSTTADEVARVALAVEICDRATRAGTPYRRIPRFTFLRLGPDVDAPGLADVAGTKAVGAHLGDRKLYGTQVAHFAAFAKAEWRRHDWLWGRLDAVAHLGRALLCHTADEKKIDAWIRDTQQLVLANEVGGASAEQLWETTEDLLGTSNGDLLAQVSPELVTKIEQRAARMLADEFDISFLPESVERALVKRLLGKLLDRLGGGGGA